MVWKGLLIGMYRVIVTTSDNYIHAIKPLHYLMKKYWEPMPEVVVGGFSDPPFDMPEGFEFISIGDMKDYPIDRWSDAVIELLERIPDEVIIFMLEDMWPISPVHSRVVDMAYDYMEQFRYVARLDLTGDRLNAGGASLYGELGHIKLIWSDPNSQYHLSTMPALWRKEHLLRVLVPGETPWQTELQGTPRLSALKDQVIVLGTNIWPIKNTLAFRGGDHAQLLLDEIDPEDVREMRDLGLLKELE
jgi:hypothetical protein